MKIPILILKILFVGALFIISTQNLHLGVSQERNVFFQEYTTWTGSLVHQVADITGYIVKFSWLPENIPNNTNTSK